MKSVFIFISLLIMLCPAFSQSRMEHYLDSLGLVNVGRMDPTLKIDLMYTRADNFTGKVLYEDLQEAYIHQSKRIKIMLHPALRESGTEHYQQ